MMIKAVVVDDEQHSLQSTRLLVERHCPEIQVVGLAGSARDGIDLIEKLHPDLVFLDIAMPVMNGFEMLQELTYRNIEIIFTTAYDEYAIRAFRVNAADYLLKPIEKAELIEAVEKVKGRIAVSGESERIERLIKLMDQQGIKNRRVGFSVEGKIRMVDLDDIVFCQSDSNYTVIHLAGGKSMMLSKTLKQVEQLIEHPDFFRVQNSYLVNLNHIKEYIRGEGGDLIMSNGKAVRVSRSKKEELLKLLMK
jgi:two-component system LytT family response regulator